MYRMNRKMSESIAKNNDTKKSGDRYLIEYNYYLRILIIKLKAIKFKQNIFHYLSSYLFFNLFFILIAIIVILLFLS